LESIYNSYPNLTSGGRMMMIVGYGGKTPNVADSALVADTAYLIGDVEVGENTSVWPGVVLRADAAPIRVGSNCHIEENTVLHGLVTIGDNTMIGHNCVIEGKVGSGTLIGNGASVLVEARVGDSCIVAAGTVVLENMEIPHRSFVSGVPAKIRGELTQHNIQMMEFYMPYYVGLVKEYKRQGIWRRET
jgi:carbonic anhydrase/acetyltransferase-like protein (isoleucine patch superfamily)